MKTEATDMMEELGLRIMSDIFDDQLMRFIFEDKPLITAEELSDFIVENLDKYLNPDELKLLLTQQLGTEVNEDINKKGTNLLCDICSLFISKAMNDTLTHPNFVKDNPFNILTNPMHFMIHKYLTEEMGLDINLKNAN